MDNVLFAELILEMNKEFPKEKKKVILIIDNCPAHPTIDNIKSTELIFLPPNTTSKLQPMDQRVICSLIAYYKALALQRLVVAINKGRDLPGFFILDAMKMLDLLWPKKKTSTIVNCIEKVRISKDEQKSAQSRMTTIPSKIFRIRSKSLVIFPAGTTAEDVISADKNMASTVPLLTKKESCPSVLVVKIFNKSATHSQFQLTETLLLK